MTRWWWVRHGPTHQKAFTGWRDVPADLSDQAKIERLRQALPDGAVTVSSDLIRAVATADAIAPEGLRLPHATDLREFDFGVWDGMHFSDVAARDPDLSRRFWEQPGDVAAPNGESWNQVAGRVGRFVDRINADADIADVVAVAHIGVIVTQVQRALGVSAYEALGHDIAPLSLTQLVHADGQWQVDAINREF